MCEVCFKTYNVRSSLRRHLRLECGKMPQFGCPYCHYKSKRKDNLRTHVVGKHKTNVLR